MSIFKKKWTLKCLKLLIDLIINLSRDRKRTVNYPRKQNTVPIWMLGGPTKRMRRTGAPQWLRLSTLDVNIIRTVIAGGWIIFQSNRLNLFGSRELRSSNNVVSFIDLVVRHWLLGCGHSSLDGEALDRPHGPLLLVEILHLPHNPAVGGFALGGRPVQRHILHLVYVRLVHCVRVAHRFISHFQRLPTLYTEHYTKHFALHMFSFRRRCFGRNYAWFDFFLFKTNEKSNPQSPVTSTSLRESLIVLRFILRKPLTVI